jgi:histidinol phosphatase-like PHP family hydrolase
MTDTIKPKHRVVCAAIRAADGELLIGIRHYSADMHNQMSKRSDGDKFYHRGGRNQGFVDQFGVYMDRREAFDVAMKAGQIINMNACTHELYSEGIY